MGRRRRALLTPGGFKHLRAVCGSVGKRVRGSLGLGLVCRWVGRWLGLGEVDVALRLVVEGGRAVENGDDVGVDEEAPEDEAAEVLRIDWFSFEE